MGALRALLWLSRAIQGTLTGDHWVFHREAPSRRCAVAESSEGRTGSAFVSDLVIYDWP